MRQLMRSLKPGALAIGLIAILIPILAQTPSKQVPPDAQQQTVPQEPSKTTTSEPAPNIQTFVGRIMSTKGVYIFKDTTGATYQLDDQKRARDFAGQSVRITGRLDPASHMIAVSSISPGS